jgi:ATP-dependent protease ClpP protease subunit
MTRLVAILVTLFQVAIPAKADVALWPRPVPGWTVIQVYGVITPRDPPDFERYTENVDPAATLVIVTGPGGNLVAGISMGLRARLKKLIVGVMGNCASSCALLWIGAETGRKFLYHSRPIALTALCFHQASQYATGPASGEGNALIAKYLATLGYNQDMIEWALAAGPRQRLCLTPELAKKFNIDFWLNSEGGDGEHYPLPGNHGLLPTTSGY